MKTSVDPRHLKRVDTVKDLFSWSFNQENTFKSDQTKTIIDNIETIDQEIKNAAVSWPIEQINKIDLSILRLAIFELIIVKDAPFKAVIDEAVELAKEFGGDSSPGFVNGVLGKVITSHGLDKE